MRWLSGGNESILTLGREMNRIERKRGHPILSLVVATALFLSCLAFFELVKLLNESEPGFLGYLNLAVRLGLAILAIGVCIWLITRGWRIESEGSKVALYSGSEEIYRGMIGDLDIIGYECGVVTFRDPCGNVFTFPAFGRILEHFVHEPTAETKLPNKSQQDKPR